jgi:hypothetical protein
VIAQHCDEFRVDGHAAAVTLESELERAALSSSPAPVQRLPDRGWECVSCISPPLASLSVGIDGGQEFAGLFGTDHDARVDCRESAGVGPLHKLLVASSMDSPLRSLNTEESTETIGEDDWGRVLAPWPAEPKIICS